MESFLEREYGASADLEEAINVAMNAWAVGHLTTGDNKEMPDPAAIQTHREERLSQSGVEAAVLERESTSAIRYRALSKQELEPLGSR